MCVTYTAALRIRKLTLIQRVTLRWEDQDMFQAGCSGWSLSVPKQLNCT